MVVEEEEEEEEVVVVVVDPVDDEIFLQLLLKVHLFDGNASAGPDLGKGRLEDCEMTRMRNECAM